MTARVMAVLISNSIEKLIDDLLALSNNAVLLNGWLIKTIANSGSLKAKDCPWPL